MLPSTVANPSSLESNDGFRELGIQVMSVLRSKELSQGSKQRRWFLRGCVLLVESCEEQGELGIISLVPLWPTSCMAERGREAEGSEYVQHLLRRLVDLR